MSDPPPWRPRHNRWGIALSVTLVAFMEILDTTIVNVALPHIAGSMSVSNDEATWTLTSYLVANGIVLPISGWFARVFGRKRYFLLCIAAFTGLQLPVRHRRQPVAADPVPPAARLLRRRAAAEPAIHHPGHVSAGAARPRLRHHRHGDGGGAGAGADTGRADYRQRLLALDFLHQRAGRRGDLPGGDRAGRGPALAQARRETYRRRRHGADRARPGLPADHPRPGRGRGLAGLAVHPAVRRADRCRADQRRRLAAVGAPAGGELACAEGPQFRRRDRC